MIEKVNPCHPDKVADRIAGAIVDLAYAAEDNPRIAVEVLIGHGVCHAIIETSATLDERDMDCTCVIHLRNSSLRSTWNISVWVVHGNQFNP